MDLDKQAVLVVTSNIFPALFLYYPVYLYSISQIR